MTTSWTSDYVGEKLVRPHLSNTTKHQSMFSIIGTKSNNWIHWNTLYNFLDVRRKTYTIYVISYLGKWCIFLLGGYHTHFEQGWGCNPHCCKINSLAFLEHCAHFLHKECNEHTQTDRRQADTIIIMILACYEIIIMEYQLCIHLHICDLWRYECCKTSHLCIHDNICLQELNWSQVHYCFVKVTYQATIQGIADVLIMLIPKPVCMRRQIACIQMSSDSLSPNRHRNTITIQKIACIEVTTIIKNWFQY